MACSCEKGEKLVNKTVDAIKSFLNPFDVPEETKLYCLSSGAATSLDIEIDIIRAEKADEEAKKQFISEGLEMKDHFFDPVKKMRLNVKKKIELCRKALIQHIRRANFQMAIWRRADTPLIESPKPTDGHGWRADDDGSMMPL